MDCAGNALPRALEAQERNSQTTGRLLRMGIDFQEGAENFGIIQHRSIRKLETRTRKGTSQRSPFQGEVSRTFSASRAPQRGYRNRLTYLAVLRMQEPPLGTLQTCENTACITWIPRRISSCQADWETTQVRGRQKNFARGRPRN